jgi:hypothetical protein
VYGFAVAGDSTPTKFFSSEQAKHPRCDKYGTRTCKQIRGEYLRYHMGLAQVCKQMRKEFLPIYLRRARVAVGWQDLPFFQDCFYKNGAFDTRGPRNLTVYLCCAFSCYAGVDVLPLLLVHLPHPEFQTEFAIDPDCHYNYPTVSSLEFHDVSRIFKFQNKGWQEELKKGTFSGIDVGNMIMNSDAPLDLGLSKGFDTKNKAAVQELSELLKDLPYGYRLYSYRNEELLYDEESTLE